MKIISREGVYVVHMDEHKKKKECHVKSMWVIQR